MTTYMDPLLNLYSDRSQSELSSQVIVSLERLTPLLGNWIGRGLGNFPTIEPFHYEENLTIERNGNAPYLIYRQMTDLVDPSGRFIRKSHWESGVIRPLPDGSVQLSCAQNSGRVEVLRGEFLMSEAGPGSCSLNFNSEVIANDPRMISSQRRWFIEGDRFTYSLSMTTSKVAQSTTHLEAELVRSAK